MWLFGQVWFACLVGFVVGVGLTWLWGVRPANRRVADLERSARTAARPVQRPSRPAEDFQPGFGNTTYDSSGTANVAAAAPSGVGVSTGSGRPGLDEMFEPERPEPAHVDATRVHSVDDYVEALVQEYQGDAPAPEQAWSNRAPEAVESWRPGALGSRLDAEEPPAQELTSYQPVQSYPEPEPQAEETTQLQARPYANTYESGNEFGGRGNADEQYLEYLRSGAVDTPSDHVVEPEQQPEPEAVRDYVAQEPEPEPEYPAQQQYQQYPAEGYAEEYPAQEYQQEYQEYPAQEQYQPHDAYLTEHEQAADVPEAEVPVNQTPAHSSEQAAEVTSVLPVIEDESPVEQTFADQEPIDEADLVDEQAVPAQRDYFQPEPEPEPLSGVVRPHSHDGGPIASAQPFQLDGPDRADNNARQGQLTPIEAGGWQPFAKPFDGEQEEQTSQDWQEDWSEQDAPVNGTHLDTEQAAAQEAPAESTSIFAPVTDVEQGFTEHDYDEDWEEHADQAAGRSLFEPVIEPELPTGYLSPVAQPIAQEEPQQNRQPAAPHPIRVRTGVAQPNRPVRAPAGSAGWQTGPFGPGSALPLPDGSAPSPQFRVKARTSSMVFHTESSPFYDRLEPQVWFTTQEDAQRAGFTSWERPRTW